MGHDSVINKTTRFASYDGNRYSALIANRCRYRGLAHRKQLVRVRGWQQARTVEGAPRAQDGSGSVVNAVGYASGGCGGNIIPAVVAGSPGDAVERYGPAGYSCSGKLRWRHLHRGDRRATSSLLATPRSRWQPTRGTAFVRHGVIDGRHAGRGDGASGWRRQQRFESLMGSPEMVNAPGSLRRYSFLFKSNKRINAADPRLATSARGCTSTG